MKFSTFDKIFILICVGAGLIGTGLYFYQFRGPFSSDAQDWNAFGGYINGVLMPILTMVNIWVFYKLTISIDRNDEVRKQKDIDFQKKMLTANLRQKLLEDFSNILNNVLAANDAAQIRKSTADAISKTEYILSQTKVFPLLANQNARKAVEKLQDILNDMYKPYQPTSIPTNEVFFSPKYLSIKEQYILEKNNVIYMLQQSIIDDL